MADLYVAPIPTCPDHGGPMRHDFPASRSVCAGWDGDGCPNTVTDEQLEWRRLGPAAGPPAGDLP